MSEPGAPKKPFPVNGRVIGILAALLVGICVAVIATDLAAPRDRNPETQAATVPATRTGGGL